MIQLFLIQLFGHMLGDFYLQDECMCAAKKNNAFRSPKLYIHALLVFGAAWIVTWNASFWWAALLITILHALVDGTKSYIPAKKCNVYVLFFVDQLIHILFLLGVTCLYSYLHGWQTWEWLIPYRAVMFLVIVFCLWPANFFISNFLKLIKIEKNANPDTSLDKEYCKTTLDASRVIGSIERILVLLFVWLGEYSAIGFLIAAKSVMRFPEMGQGKNNAEYYVVGSLLSFGLSIVLGVLTIALHSKGIL